MNIWLVINLVLKSGRLKMQDNLLRFNTTDEFVFIDLETFNLCLSFIHNRPWQAGLVKVKGSNIIDKKDIYIKWDTDLSIGEEAAKITRFDLVKFNSLAIEAKKAFIEISNWLDNCDKIIGHNILNFDIYLLKGMYEYFGKDWSHLLPKMIDTNAIAKGIKLDQHWKRDESFIEYQYKLIHFRKKGLKSNLTSLGKENDIEHDYDSLHDALSDLELNVKIWNKLKFMTDI